MACPLRCFIDEPVILERSDPVALSRVEDSEFIIDVSEIPLVIEGTYNDLFISYWTATSCDEDTHILNSKKQTWEQIGFAIDPGSGLGCRQSPRQHFHLLSPKGCDAKKCVDDSAHVRLRGPLFTYYQGMIPMVEALRINPDYFTVPIPVRYASGFNGLAYAYGSLWTSTAWFDKVYRISFSGEVLSEFDSPSESPFGMAFDGRHLWLADSDGTVFKMNKDGEVLGSFSLQVHAATGLAYGGGKIWVADHGRNVPYHPPMIYGVDFEACCAGGSVVATDTLQVPGGKAYGLAWDGSHLLVPSDRLYRVTPSGVVTESHPLPVHSVTDIAWDGEAVWMLNGGPKDLGALDPVITRFRLR